MFLFLLMCTELPPVSCVKLIGSSDMGLRILALKKGSIMCSSKTK
jgi:hypothetical protein